MKKIRYLMTFLMMCMAFFICQVQAEASSLADNPNISWVPDGQAFTTDTGEKGYIQYPLGTTIDTGLQSSIRALNTGEHYYKKGRSGAVPIGKWVASYSPGRCIHNSYPDEGVFFHGLSYGRSKCLGKYKTGWIGYCADCNDPIHILFYMDKETAESITKLQMELDYFYLCPHCNNLEQGVEITHDCNSISWNKYRVIYNSNVRNVSGYMDDSIFMYNNETIYEGNPIFPEKWLRKCIYLREGYEFIGWNTKPDGTGMSFSDE